ncbi:hypothetical protein PAEPH01_0773 [Pancytospora epiphaga]|nr:hypothetical protein PAEPH01_0773 [Pancytospora epiphaga]
MKTLLSDLYKNLMLETGTSFIFGTTTAALKGTINNDSNIIVKQIQALRKGYEHARYTMIYNTLLYICTRMRLKHIYASAFSIFVSSYLVGARNGLRFAFKNGLFGLLMSFLSRAYG